MTCEPGAAVADVFDHLLTSWNLETAAPNYLAVAGFVCHHRPHQAARLLRLPIDCLVQLGIERPEQVFGFVRSDLERAAAHFTEDAGPEGLEGLAAELTQLGGLVGELHADGMRRYPAD
jgi:hypothetical protein